MEKEKTFDGNLLKSNLKKIVCEIFDDYKNRRKASDICAVALYADEEAMSVSMAINTYNHFKDSIKEYPEDALDFKYNPEEWETIVENTTLDGFNESLQKIYFKTKKKQRAEYRDSIFRISVEMLYELKTDGYFNDMNDDFVLLFSISSFEFPEIVIEYNKKYNSSAIAKEYEHWVNETENFEDEE